MAIRAVAEGFAEPRRRIANLEEADATLDSRVTRIEVRVGSLMAKSRTPK